MPNVLNTMGSISPNNITATAKRISTYFPDCDITVGIFNKHNPEVEKKFREKNLDTMFFDDEFSWGQVCALQTALLKNQKYDVFHIYGGPITHAPVFQLTNKITRTPTIMRFNGYYNPSGHLKSALKDTLEKELLIRADAVIFNSHYQMMDILRPHNMNKKSTFHVIPPGIKEDIFQNEPQSECDVLRDSLDISEDCFIIGTCQTPRPVKQVEKMIDVVVKLNNLTDTPVHLIVIGDSNYIREYSDYAKMRDIQANIHWVGHRNHSELSIWYSLFDVTILTSRYESFGMSFTESFLCETPCVGFNIGGMAEQINHGESGYLAQPYDIEEMAQLVLRILTDETERSRFGRNGRQIAEKRFLLSKSSEKYRNIIRNII